MLLCYHYKVLFNPIKTCFFIHFILYLNLRKLSFVSSIANTTVTFLEKRKSLLRLITHSPGKVTSIASKKRKRRQTQQVVLSIWLVKFFVNEYLSAQKLFYNIIDYSYNYNAFYHFLIIWHFHVLLKKL